MSLVSLYNGSSPWSREHLPTQKCVSFSPLASNCPLIPKISKEVHDDKNQILFLCVGIFAVCLTVIFFFSWSSRLISIFRHYSLLVVFPLFFCHSHMSSVGNAFWLLHGKIMLFFKTKLRLWGASLLKCLHWGFLFDSNPSVQFSNYLMLLCICIEGFLVDVQ